MKKSLPVKVEESTIDELKKEAKEENRSLSNHVDTLLTKHIQKREHSHTPKHETK